MDRARAAGLDLNTDSLGVRGLKEVIARGEERIQLTNLGVIQVLGALGPQVAFDFSMAFSAAGYSRAQTNAYLNMVEEGIMTHKAGTEGSKTEPNALRFRASPAEVPPMETLGAWIGRAIEPVIGSDFLAFFENGGKALRPATEADYGSRAGC